MPSRTSKYPLWLVGTLLGAQLAGCTIGQSVLAPLRDGGAGDTGAETSVDGAGGDAGIGDGDVDGAVVDGGTGDGDTDGGAVDGGAADGDTDGGVADGDTDGGAADGDTDGGAVADAAADAGDMDAGGTDAGGTDAGGTDAGGGMDAGGMDAGGMDAGGTDAARDAADADVAADTACPTGQVRCGASCVNTNTSPTNCGMCGRTCPGGVNAMASCAAGVCGLTCAMGFGNCDMNNANGCETNTNTTILHCGRCGNVCPTPANSTPTCAAGACGFTCLAGFANCDGNAANGCETNLTAPGSCGRCGNMCPTPPNATPACAMGTCSFACRPGFANCDGNAGNGCEIDMATDRFHCGRCGNMCPVGAACRGGVCLCSLGTTVCSGVCVDLTSDTNNCGICGRTCPAGQVCGGGVCRPTCASGLTLCGTQCVRLGDDVNNCGMCGRRCAGSETCAGGVCVPVMSIDPIGCADGARDAFTNRTTFPNIAGCSGAWQLAGIFPAIPKSLLPICSTLGDDSLTAPMTGLGCSSSNLCAPGWHICNGGEVSPRTGGTGCAATTDYPAGTFYAASVSGTGCNVCALRSGTVTGAACTSSSCTVNCRESGDLNNDFFGCGVIGSGLTASTCDGLNRASGDNCGSLGAPWVCGGSVMESRTVIKTGPAAGGVLCCRD